MTAAAGYDPQDPTWRREGAGADEEQPDAADLEELAPVYPPRIVTEPDPWQPPTKGHDCEPF